MSSTLRELRRIAAIGLWTGVAFVAYFSGLVAVLWLQIYAQRHYGWQPLARWMPRWVPVWLVIDSVLGIVPLCVTLAALLLGMGGKLPWTGKRREPPRGFPVSPVGPPVPPAAGPAISG